MRECAHRARLRKSPGSATSGSCCPERSRPARQRLNQVEIVGDRQWWRRKALAPVAWPQRGRRIIPLHNHNAMAPGVLHRHTGGGVAGVVAVAAVAAVAMVCPRIMHDCLKAPDFDLKER